MGTLLDLKIYFVNHKCHGNRFKILYIKLKCPFNNSYCIIAGQIMFPPTLIRPLLCKAICQSYQLLKDMGGRAKLLENCWFGHGNRFCTVAVTIDKIVPQSQNSVHRQRKSCFQTFIYCIKTCVN